MDLGGQGPRLGPVTGVAHGRLRPGPGPVGATREGRRLERCPGSGRWRVLSLAAAEAFAQHIESVSTPSELFEAVAAMGEAMGFRYFALTHHVDLRAATVPAIRLHNYPLPWADWFDENRLGPTDPIHRASRMTSVGFAWTDLPRMIALTSGDLDILRRAEREGIGGGFTVPAHVPGESNGSCSFAVGPGERVPEAQLPLAHLAGAFAFEGARRLWRMREAPRTDGPRLTDRQRDCLIWAARGKTDWEIGRILGVSQETVIQHLKQARERYGAGKRTQLAVHALYDGTISFHDILSRGR